MNNPFTFSDVVEGDSFCNREKEQEDLGNYIRNSQNILLYSHRRSGKTSLINKVFGNERGVRSIYVDLFGTTTVEEFIAALYKGISGVETSMDKLMRLIKEKITTLTMQFSVDLYTGAPLAIPVFTPVDKKPALTEAFSLLQFLSTKKKLAVAFDEFQEISKYGDDALEKHLRKSIQWHTDVSYIFAGSQKHLLTEMFSDSKRAFYKQAAGYPLKKIKTGHYVKWVQGLYARADREIGEKYIRNVVSRCENHPMHIQEYFHHLWYSPDVTMAVVEDTGLSILKNKTPEYVTAWNSLTLNQRKTLKLLVATGGEKIFSADNLSRMRFKSASQVKKALEVLERREFVSRDAHYHLQDVFLKQWIRKIS